MQADNSSHNTAKCRGDLGIGRVGEVLLTVYEVVVDFGVERVSDLADVAGKFDQISAGANFSIVNDGCCGPSNDFSPGRPVPLIDAGSDAPTGDGAV